MLSKSISTSRKFTELAREGGKLGEFAQTLYLLLIPHSDDFGRLEGDPFTIKHLVFPVSPRSERDFGIALQAMAKMKLIKWYVIDGQHFVEITQFDKHQSGLHKRTKSAFPDPDGYSGNFPEIPLEQKRTEQKRTEDNGTEEKENGTEQNGTEEDMGDSPSPSPIDGELLAEFEAIKPLYPRRDGDQRWRKASSLYCAARKKGEPLEDIRDGVARYAKWCDRRRLVGTEMVKQAATFFGPEQSWRDAWPASSQRERGFVG